MHTLSLPHKQFIFLRKHYRVFVITSLSLAIIFMTWYLRGPLYQKYLIVKSKNFPLILMSDKYRYLVSQNDYLSGKAIPNSKVKVLLNPGRIKKTLQVDEEGFWFYQIPLDAPKKKYRLTVADFDKDNKLAFVKDYRVRIQSNNVLLQNPLKKLLTFPSAKAQTKTSPSASSSPVPAPTANDIILLNFSGDITPNSEINVDMVASNDGSFVPSYQAVVALEQMSSEEGIFMGKNLSDPVTSIIPLPGGENCTKSCKVKLPKEFDRNSLLTVYLINNGSITDYDYFPLIFEGTDFTYPQVEETVSEQILSEEGIVTEEELKILEEDFQP